MNAFPKVAEVIVRCVQVIASFSSGCLWIDLTSRLAYKHMATLVPKERIINAVRSVQVVLIEQTKLNKGVMS